MGKVKKVTGIDVAAPVKVVQQGVKAIQNAPGINVLSKAATDVFQPIEKAVVQPIGQGLASFDKSVGKVIPGGWGTVGMVAASMIPGMQPLTMAGLGAINGSGVLRKGGNFNLQGAMMGGAMAYGMSSLAQYAQAASAAGPTVPGVTPTPTVDAMGNFINPATGEIGSGLAGNASGMIVDPSTLTSGNTAALNALSAPLEAGAGAGLQVAPSPSIASQIMSGNFSDALSQAGQNISSAGSSVYDKIANAGTSAQEGIASLGTKAANAYDTLTTPETYSNFAKSYGESVSNTGEGIKNIITGSANPAAAEAVKSGLIASPATSAVATIYGGMGLADLEAQRNYLQEQQAANNISQQEYNSAVAEIDRSIADARRAISNSPFSTEPDRSASVGETFYNRNSADENLYGRSNASNRLYASGGAIDDEMGFDNSPRGLGNGNMSNGFMGGRNLSYAQGGNVSTYAKGGEARERREFLDMIETDFKSPPAQYVEGMGFVTPPPSVEGRLGGNFDALGGNIRAGISGNAMMTPDKKIIATPGMMDIGYKGRVGPGDLDVGIQRAIRGVPGRGKDYAVTANYNMAFAEGGMPPRFLSGGGDGMSDSIPATINGKQEARLADGEFVVPADVVSHLGNGSSKAGAKRLYSMMDKVRSARTGTKKQAPAVNVKKLMPA